MRSVGEDERLQIFDVADSVDGQPIDSATCTAAGIGLNFSDATPGANGRRSMAKLSVNPKGFGIDSHSGKVLQFDGEEAIRIHFDVNVIVESIEFVAGNGQCGGWYQINRSGRPSDRRIVRSSKAMVSDPELAAKLQIYCIDGDVDSREQYGALSDLGVLLRGDSITVSSQAHLGVESPGQWRIGSITVRRLDVRR